MKVQATALALLVYCAAIFGSIRFTATTDHTNVVPGEQVTVTVELVSDKSMKGVSPPPVAPSDAFSVVNVQQNQSQSSQIQFTSRGTVQTTEIHYVFYYTIVPKKTGGFAFPALQVSIDNTPYATESISFNAAAEPAAKNADIRVMLHINKPSLYVGEQTIVTFTVAQRANTQLQLDGGWNGAVDAVEKAFGKNFSLARLFTNQLTQGTERLGGEMYRTASLRWALISLAGGTVTVPSIAFAYQELKQVRQRGGDPFFDNFFGGAFGGGVQAIQRSAFSNELTIRAKELPPPPADFSGSIGTITLSAAIDPSSVPSGEAATLKVMVAAATRPGNVAEVTAPKLPDCEIFTPEKHVQVDTTAAGVATKKSYKFLMIPSQEGTLTIPPIAITYFDPYEGAYKTATSGPLSLVVTPGKGGAKPSTHYLTQEEIHELGSDIRYIKTDVRLRNVSDKPYRDPIFFLLYPLPFLIVLCTFLYKMRARNLEVNAAYYTRARAMKAASKVFDAIRHRGATLSTERFLGSIAETIEHYISQKFSFAATGRTLEELKADLLQRNADEAIVTDLTKFIEMLDSYRFGGAAFDEQSRSAVIDKAAAFLASLERGARKGGKIMNGATIGAVLMAAVLLGVSPGSAAPVNLWFEQANKFYTAQQYDSAVAYYDKIVSAGETSPVVYFNLGNAYFRLKKLGMSRLCYEKAALLDPSDADAAANIKFLSSNIVDRVPEPQRGFLEAVLHHFHSMMPLRAQLWFCGILLLVMALLISAALFTTGNNRLWLIYLSVIGGLILCVVGTSMTVKIYDAETSAWAVLLDPAADARNEPEGAKILFTAHEGTKFQIRKTVEGWSLVSLPNGAAGWVENKALGRI